MKHVSVLLNESIAGLSIRESGIYVDATLGYAGHRMFKECGCYRSGWDSF